MSTETLKITKPLLAGIYGYLCLPMILFLSGWCKWYIAVPSILIVCISFWMCMKEHSSNSNGVPDSPSRNPSVDLPGKLSLRENTTKCCAILLIVMYWVALSGVGGYVWQNDDHECRNAIFDLLVEKSWPVTNTVSVNGFPQERGLVYYIGFWLPAAIIGKLFGLNAGYAAQYIWAVVGILLFYALICAWRRKIVIWPLFIIIFFSGADAVGTLLNSEDALQVLGSDHLERWAAHYQFSSMTTQLFWVFNQAIPAWLASALIFLSEKPKNLVFTWSLVMITSTLPFAGLLPYLLYFMISRAEWGKISNVPQLFRNAWKNWASFQNIFGGGIAGLISFFYLTGNVSAGNSPLLNRLLMSSRSEISGLGIFILILTPFLLLAVFWGVSTLFLLGKKQYVLKTLKWIIIVGVLSVGGRVLLNSHAANTYVYKIFFLFTFYIIEVGIYLICLNNNVKDKVLLGLTAAWLLVTPLIVVGSSQDFCMRASIPALLLIILWCIDAMDTRKRTLMTWILIGVFMIGSITPLHEFKRTYINSRDGYELQSVGEEGILFPGNFSGEVKGIFWEGVAR